MNQPAKLSAIIALTAAFVAAAHAATFQVTNTDDSGAGSLRQAITDANGNAGADVIDFAIPGAGVHTITPASALPMITDPVMIDGTSQGASATPLIELNFSNVGTYGLWITAGSSTVRHLAINRAPRSGIYITGSGGNVVEGNFVGTDPSGTIARPNGEFGVFVDGPPNNLIGGTTPAARNIVSGNNQFSGIGIGGSTATGNVVQGNYVGTDVTGTVALRNSNDGVYLGTDSGVPGAPSNCTVGGTAPGAGNLISGNGGNGVEIYGPNASGNVVEGNFIGTNAAGTGSIGNEGDGVNIGDAAGGHTIGGTAAGARNIISGNGTGVHIVAYGTVVNGSVLQAANHIVQGNYIGTDVTGTLALANAGNGVLLESANNNTIGGSAAGAGNVISGNLGDGVYVEGITAANNQISGNLIGRNAANTGALGNAKHGLYFIGSGPNTIGGGFDPNNANVIAHNQLAGVAIVFANGASIRKGILSNSIFSNGGLGIDLGDDGVTPNDPMDVDTGPNALQNYPVLTSAEASGTVLGVAFTFNSAPNKTFRIEFFSSETADPSGFGEGQTFLNAADITTDASGNAAQTIVMAPPPFGQNFITATATDSAEMANTSEFSNAISLERTPDRLQNISTRMRVLTGDNVLIGGLIISGSGPKRVLFRSIGPSMMVGENPVPGTLQDPVLTLYDSAGREIASNDDWVNAPEPERTEIEASGLQPGDNREPAILRTLSPGAYTAIVRGKNETIGIATVEAYDQDPVPMSGRGTAGNEISQSRLANLSARGLCSTDDNIMIGGVIIGGGGGAGVRVIARGIGPSLAINGNPIPGRLVDPRLAIFDSNGMSIASNNDWKTDQQSEIEATGLAPTSDAESAIVSALPPGMFTIQLRGNANSTGIGLIEIYELPELPPAH